MNSEKLIFEQGNLFEEHEKSKQANLFEPEDKDSSVLYEESDSED